MNKKNVSFSKDNLKKLARSIHIFLKNEEIKLILTQLQDTIKSMGNISRLDTKKISPTSQVTNLKNVFFTDGAENKAGLTKEEALANAKNKRNNCFVVKRLIG